MFNRVGSKLKSLAEAVSFLGICASIIWGGFVIEEGIYRGMVHGPTLLKGLGIAVGGSLVAWIIALFIYGFGQLIENTANIPQLPKSRLCSGLAMKNASADAKPAEEVAEGKEEEAPASEEEAKE